MLWGLGACGRPGGADSTAGGTVAQAQATDIVGAWDVTIVGAPYQPHLFLFLSGGGMLSTNPTNVQQAPADGSAGTNDSVGIGTWETAQTGAANTYQGTFKELNADARTHTPADTLVVTWIITVSGDTLTGKAQAGLSSDLTKTRPATFTGKRITTNQAMLATVA